MKTAETQSRRSVERRVRMRIWDVSGVLLNDDDIIIAAMEYGYGGNKPTGAAAVLTHWGYEVSHYYAKHPKKKLTDGGTKKL